jgi:hypothetical protein
MRRILSDDAVIDGLLDKLREVEAERNQLLLGETPPPDLSRPSP